MPTLTINEEDLLVALRERNPQVESWLDCETGDIYQISALFGDDEAEDDPAFATAMQQTPERFLRLPLTPAELGYQSMQAFCASMANAPLRTTLLAALQRQRAFFHFQDQLLSAPDEWARWQDFSRKKTLAWALTWLRDRGFVVQLSATTADAIAADESAQESKGST